MGSIPEVIAKKWLDGLTEEQRASFGGIAYSVIGFAREVGKITQAIAQACKQIEIDHDRDALLKLYRQRHKWKKSDVVRIETYKLNKFARIKVLRLKKLKLVGRGTTIVYQPLAKKLIGIGKYLLELAHPQTSPSRRLYLLKKHPSWWPQFVESIYRGEYARLKELGGKSPSVNAEQAVAEACCISTSSVRQICVSIRKDPVARSSPSRAMTVADFENWKRTGKFPPKTGELLLEENTQKLDFFEKSL